ncbi:hypothetical protein BU16DRAFT_459208, partial [Lophium mytilinum]
FYRAYINNIIIYSKSLNNYIKYLRALFKALIMANIILKGPKSYLIYLFLTLLG